MGDTSEEEQGSGLEYLKNKRKYMRSEVTKTHTKIASEINTLSVEEKTRILSRLGKLRAEVEVINEKIFSCLFSAAASEESKQREYDSCVDYENTFDICVSKLKEDVSAAAAGARPDNVGNYNRTALKLPHVPLPEYGHREGEDLHKFILNFENVIEKYNLSSYEKFVYLQRQLSNEPLTIIRSLEIGRQNYADAKDLLTKAFASPVTQQYRLLQQLSELKMGRNDDPYEFISPDAYDYRVF